MAENMVISTGLSDSELYLQSIANARAPFEVTPQSGNYPLVGNVLVNRRLSSQWMAISLFERAFVDGLGVTSAGAEGDNVGMLRVPLLYMPPRRKRTLGSKMCPTDGSTNGTPNNNEPFNKNLPYSLQTDAVDVKFLQVYDEAAQVAKTTMRLIGSSLDLLGKHTSYIPKTVGFLQDADIMATHLGAGLAHAYATGNSNIIAYKKSDTTKGALQKLLNNLVSKLSNVRGSYKEGIISYDKQSSVIVMRWTLWNALLTIDNGAIINSDIGQKILITGKLNESGDKLLGSYIEGMYNGVYIKVLPDEMFDTAAATLNLTSAQYEQWNKVVAYIANAEGFVFGQSAANLEVDKAPTTSMGFIVRNDWGWGVKCTRPSAIGIVVESETDLADFTNPCSSFLDINSPNDLEAIIAAYQNGSDVTGVQRIGVVSPALVTAVTLTLKSAASGNAAITNAEVIVREEDGAYATVGNNGDGTYTFTLPRASTATVAMSADGFTAATFDITATDTATATKAISKQLTVAS